MTAVARRILIRTCMAAKQLRQEGTFILGKSVVEGKLRQLGLDGVMQEYPGLRTLFYTLLQVEGYRQDVQGNWVPRHVAHTLAEPQP